ncbi:MAG TPA: hemerythrin domain-containing protein [Sphingomonas sp.]|nr:hemerythrin domain-containing protein [Sphingomonas sp.]
MSSMMKRLLEEHEKLRQLSSVICELLEGDEPCDLRLLARSRWELASTAYRHLVFEERQVFQRLLTDPRPEARMMSERSREAIQQLHSAYKTHVDAWTAEEVVARWREFGIAVTMLVRHMNIRIGFEEKHLFPLLGDDPQPLPTRLPGARNWAGDAVALESAIKLQASLPVPAAIAAGARAMTRREGKCPASAY